MPDIVFPIYNVGSSESQKEYELVKAAKKLGSLFTVLEEWPDIKYFSTSKNSKTLAALLENTLNEIRGRNPKFPTETSFQPPTLIVLDRGFDMAAPLLHEFTYQALIYDLLDLEDSKYRYESEKDSQLVSLDESDGVWIQLRHLHIAEAMELLSQGVQDLTSNNKAAQFEMLQKSGAKTNADQISAIKDTLTALPEYQELKSKYSLHTKICQDCMRLFNENDLETVSQIEQEIVTGFSASGKPPKNLWASLMTLLKSADVLPDDKLRLIMLYIVSEHGISDGDRHQLMEAADLSMDEKQALTNLSMLGVRISQSYEKKRFVIRLSVRATNQRIHSPQRQEIQMDQLRNNLDSSLFPWLRSPKPSSNQQNSPSTAPLRSTKASWATKKSAAQSAATSPLVRSSTFNEDLRRYGPRIIVFVIGGITHSEIRTCYELSKEFSRDIIIGSTHVLDPLMLSNTLKVFHRGPPVSLDRSKKPPKATTVKPETSSSLFSRFKKDKTQPTTSHSSRLDSSGTQYPPRSVTMSGDNRTTTGGGRRRSPPRVDCSPRTASSRYSPRIESASGVPRPSASRSSPSKSETDIRSTDGISKTYSHRDLSRSTESSESSKRSEHTSRSASRLEVSSKTSASSPRAHSSSHKTNDQSMSAHRIDGRVSGRSSPPASSPTVLPRRASPTVGTTDLKEQEKKSSGWSLFGKK